MVATHKGAISFGLVHIPIQMYKTTQDIDISFNQLCKDSHERVKYKKYCPNCEKEIGAKDIVKGYQYEKDKYVVMTNDEIENLKVEKDRTITILHFTKLSKIDNIFFEKNYYAIPERHAEKAYELLYLAMKKKKVVAIAKSVIGTKETLLALCPEEQGIIVKTLFYQEEIAPIPITITHPKVSKEEIAVAEQLIASMTTDYHPEDYHDNFQEKLREAIAAKINGNEIIHSNSKEKIQAPVDLMKALQESISRVGNDKFPINRSPS